MNALIQLQAMGYGISLKGDKIKLVWKREDDPDPDKARPLIEEVKANKKEAFQYLQKQGRSENGRNAGSVSNKTLDEFKKVPIGVRIWSKPLKRRIWLVSDKGALEEYGIEGLYFTGEELEHLIRMTPTIKDLEAIVDIKEELGGELIEFSQKNDGNQSHE